MAQRLRDTNKDLPIEPRVVQVQRLKLLVVSDKVVEAQCHELGVRQECLLVFHSKRGTTQCHCHPALLYKLHHSRPDLVRESVVLMRLIDQSVPRKVHRS